MLASTGPATLSVCPAAVIPTMACCYRPSHGMAWCGLVLSQSVSRDLSSSLPLGRWMGWVHKLGCGCGFGMHRWACIIATQLGADFGRRPVEELEAPLPHLPAPSARFSARFAVPEHKERPPPSVPTRHGKEGGCGWVREHTARAEVGGEKDALGSFGSKATPGPAPCSVHSSLACGGWGKVLR